MALYSLKISQHLSQLRRCPLTLPRRRILSSLKSLMLRNRSISPLSRCLDILHPDPELLSFSISSIFIPLSYYSSINPESYINHFARVIIRITKMISFGVIYYGIGSTFYHTYNISTGICAAL